MLRMFLRFTKRFHVSGAKVRQKKFNQAHRIALPFILSTVFFLKKSSKHDALN